MAAALFHIAMTKLKRSLLRVTHVWAAIHVERHGLYSVERLRNQKYQTSGSLARSWLILLLTSLPCFAVITLLDVIPLKPPDVGLASSHSFWLPGLRRIAFSRSPSRCSFVILSLGSRSVGRLAEEQPGCAERGGLLLRSHDEAGYAHVHLRGLQLDLQQPIVVIRADCVRASAATSQDRGQELDQQERPLDGSPEA